MELHNLSRTGYLKVIIWAILLSIVAIGAIAALGRGTLNLNAALTEKPDIGIYLLLDDKNIEAVSVDLLREKENERDYLVFTKESEYFVKLKRGEEEWYIAVLEEMRE